MASLRLTSFPTVISCAAVLGALPCGPAQAQMPTRSAPAVSGDWVQLGVAYLDVSARQGEEAGLEGSYRWGEPLVWRLHPQVGAALFSDGSAYAYSGLALPVRLGARLSLSPSMSAGAFSAGEEVHLGSAIEFRSALTLGVSMGRDHGLSLSFYHLSNAGLGDRNPGVEVLGLAYWVRR